MVVCRTSHKSGTMPSSPNDVRSLTQWDPRSRISKRVLNAMDSLPLTSPVVQFVYSCRICGVRSGANGRDMLGLCQENAAREGVTPRLFAQLMHGLNLAETYKTVLACGSFGLSLDRQHDREAPHRLYPRLETGGVLVFTHHLTYKNAEASPTSAEPRRATGGGECEMRLKPVEMDPLEQVMTLQIYIEARREGQLVVEEEVILKEHVSFKNEQESIAVVRRA